MDIQPIVPQSRKWLFRCNRGAVLAALFVAVFVLGVTLCTPSGIFAPSYGSAPDFDGDVYGFPFGSIWIPIRSGNFRVDLLPLVGDFVLAAILFAVVEVARRCVRLWQYSLRRLLLAVFFVALSFGCFRLASVQDIQVAIIPGVLSMGLALGLLTNHFVAACAAVAMLALISYCHCWRWDGRFPTGQIRLRVCDESGSPIAGAQFEVYDGKSRRVVCGPPLLMEDSRLPLLTDANGQVICHSLGRGFSGVGRDLFWCIPIGSHCPEYDCLVSHKDYGSLRVSLSTILGPSNKVSSSTVLVFDGKPQEMAIYDATVTLPCK
jgi:hypothetical protein